MAVSALSHQLIPCSFGLGPATSTWNCEAIFGIPTSIDLHSRGHVTSDAQRRISDCAHQLNEGQRDRPFWFGSAAAGRSPFKLMAVWDPFAPFNKYVAARVDRAGIARDGAAENSSVVQTYAGMRPIGRAQKDGSTE